MDVRKAIKCVPALQTLPQVQQDALIRSGWVIRVDAGALVWERGDPATEFMILLDGEVRLVARQGEREVLIGIVQTPGDILCSPAVCGALPHCCESICNRSTQLLALPRAAIPVDAGLTQLLMTQLAGRAIRLCRRLREFGGTGPVDQRVAAVLLRLADERGVPAEDRVQLPRSLARRDLAGLSGCATETLIRVLARFEAQQLLRRTERGLELHTEKLASWLRNQQPPEPES